MTTIEHAEPLWTAEQTAEHLNVAARTLESWRRRDHGPPWITLVAGRGGLIRYEPAAVRDWVAQQTTTPERVPA